MEFYILSFKLSQLKFLFRLAQCLLFSYFGRYAPEIISHGGLSLNRLVGFQWLDQEAIFGIPIGVSVDFIFLFVLFGALLETAGGGKFYKEKQEEKKEDIYSNIDEMLNSTLDPEDKD